MTLPAGSDGLLRYILAPHCQVLQPTEKFTCSQTQTVLPLQEL